MAETPIPAPIVESITPKEEEGNAFAGLLETLGMVIDTNVALDKMQGKKRNVADIMKDLLASTKQKLEAAKATREGKE